MKKELEDKLLNEFEEYFKDRDDPQKSLVFFGFECGDGWYDILYKLLTDLKKIGFDGQVSQVKEKFGGLRFYIWGGEKEAYDLIDEAEEKSYKVCEICGDTETACLRGGGWLYTLCDDCSEDREPLSDTNI